MIDSEPSTKIILGKMGKIILYVSYNDGKPLRSWVKPRLNCLYNPQVHRK